MMTRSSVTVRVDLETKREVTKIVEDFGFDLSGVTRAFYRQIIRERRIPLNLSYELPNDDSLQAIKESDELLENGEPGFKSVDEFVKALEE